MGLSKQSRTKKGRVAPISDDDGGNNSSGNAHRSDSHQLSQASRGVSFSTPRGKIWLILVINLAIVTTFIFLSSYRFPSLIEDSVLTDVLEHSASVTDNAKQFYSLPPSDPEVTKEPRVQGTPRPGGYTKVTSTTAPNQEKQMLEQKDTIDIEVEESSPVTQDDDTGTDIEAGLPRETESVKQTENSLPTVTPSNIHTTTISPAPPSDAAVESNSATLRPRQRPQAEITALISRMKESAVPSSETLSPERQEQSPTTSTGVSQSIETLVEVRPAAAESKGMFVLGLRYHKRSPN
ncbi:unnamed protein product [Phytophthora fragariaefolia]|uniref:Unnamed protein product n=1 Tax=Phytophthora fragariaefolia TaxID=1490495 RepID=A0A9W6TXU5_9STRA|nr:unnamed protein product [Phytophthora fragariaefolia]